MELLAPAGSLEVLEAAVSAGADAVYFGLDELNARRGAENISTDKLEAAVSIAHEKNCRAYLAINIDIAERETGLAARYLEFACAKSVDAVIVKDPMFFKLIPFFPQMRFHLSTQAAISSSAGVRAAKEFGFSRVVLPRELSREEVLAASSVEGIETELFVQGALCFCISGRCLLSSWLGGRSGNRGLCASPCRFLWQYENNSARLLSARDISLAKKIKDIEACGVRALKIEGRLKNKEWVAKTVKLFRKVLDEPNATIEESEFAALGDYAGRTSTCSFFEGLRTDIVGDSGRTSSTLNSECSSSFTDSKQGRLDIFAQICKEKIHFKLQCGNRIKEFAIKTLHQGKRYKTGTDLLDEIKSRISDDIKIGDIALPADIKIPNNAFRDFRHELNSFLHQIQKSADTYLKIPLSSQIREALEKTKGNCPQNNKTLPALPDCVRLASFADFCEFRKFYPEIEIILENAEAPDIDRIQALNVKKPVISLPLVFYESDIEKIISLLQACSRGNFEVEVNSWDGWFLAKEAKIVSLRGGPGLMVLNSVAAFFLLEIGCKSVFASIEADCGKLTDLCSATKVPIYLYVYGRPALMISRACVNVEAPENGLKIKEKKGNIFIVKYEGDLFVLRPETPFNISSESSEDLRISQFVADLVSEKNPLRVFKNLCEKSNFLPTNSFNFHRVLG